MLPFISVFYRRRRSRWLAVWLLVTLLGSLGLAYGQTAAPFTVRVTPAGPVNLSYGQSQVLTASAVYPAFKPGTGFNGNVNATAVQADGKVLVGGSFTSYNGTPRNYLARLNADGSLDMGFTAGTELNASVYAIAVQANGDILIGGDFTLYNGTACSRLARITSAGVLDPSFATSGAAAGFDGAVRAIGIQTFTNSFSVVVGGEFGAYGTNANSNYLVRFDSSGNFDTGFASLTHPTAPIINYFNAAVLAIVVQTGNSLLVGGRFIRPSSSGPGWNGIARLASSGAPDAAFNSSTNSGPLSGEITTIAEVNNKIVVGGSFNGYRTNNTSYPYNCLAFLTSVGELDTSFSAGFAVATSFRVNSIAVLSATRLVVGGQFTAYGGNPSSNIAGLLTNTGAFDSSFATGTGFSTIVNSLTPQANGNVVVGGQFTTYKGAAASYIARLKPTGSLDDTDTPIATASLAYTWHTSTGSTGTGSSFTASPSAGTSATYWATAVLTGVAATATSNTVVVSTLLNPIAVRVTPDAATLCAGTSQTLTASAVYPAFVSGVGFDGSVRALALQPDGKVLVGGDFTMYSGATRKYIARLNADGSLDTSFAPYPANTGFDNAVTALALQPDGRVLVGGAFTNCNGTTRKYIARLNTDGSLDNSFAPYPTITGFNNTNTTASAALLIVQSIALQPDGKVLVGGAFTSYNGTTRQGIARLNTDGSLDNSFVPSPGVGGNSFVVSLVLQPDGKVLVGGGFVSFNNMTRRYIARLNPDGTLDSFASTGAGTNAGGIISALALQPDDKVLFGGGFTSFNNTPHARIARLDASGSLDTFASTGLGFDGNVQALALQPDGKVLGGGDFTTFTNGTPRGHVARLDASGNLDTFASTGAGFDGSVRSIVLQPDGKVLVGGDFTKYNGLTCKYIARLNADGSLNTADTPIAGVSAYSWTPGISSTAASVAVTPGATTLYTATATVAGASATGSATLTVNPSPTAVPGAAVSFCSGGSAQLGAAPVSGLTYSWSPTTGLSSNTLANPTITLMNPGSAATTQLYTLTVANPLTGCASSGTVNVTVNPLPIAAPGTAASICSGGSAQLGATPVAGYIYSWSPATGLSNATLANPLVTLTNTTNAPTTQTYTLTVVGIGGCASTGTVTVTTTPLPVILSFTPGSGPAGAAVTLTGTGFFGVTAVKFNGVAGQIVAINPAGTQLTVIVPATTASSRITVETACGTASSSGSFSSIINLVVGPTTSPIVQSGIYNTITVLPGGNGMVRGGNVTVLDSVAVLDGGTLRLGPFRVQGTGYFRLATGGTLSIGYHGGLTATDTTGAVKMTGLRRYSLDASYIYTGKANQITGLGLPTRVRNLTDSTKAGAALALAAPTSVAQVLTVASASDFNLAGHALTLLSDAAGTALVVNGPQGGKVLGTATMQRYIDPAYNAGTGYRYYSPPVAGASIGTLATAAFTPRVNVAYNASSAPTPATVVPFPNVFQYDQARLSLSSLSLPNPFDKGLLSPGDTANLMAVGTGYAVNIAATEKIRFKGTLTTGLQTLPNLTRGAGLAASGNGWNLVGNPYPAPLDWSAVAASDRLNLDAALYTYESTGPNAGIYFSYVNGIGGSPVVAAGKSFFVRVKQGQSSGSLTLRNSHRLTSFATQAGFARTQQLSPPLVELELDYNGGKKGGRPPTSVYVDNSALPYRLAAAFDSERDAYRIPATTNLNLSIDPTPSGTTSPLQSEELAIKAVPAFTPSLVLPLIVRVPAASTRTVYELHAFAIQNLPAGTTPWLEDRILKRNVNLLTTPSDTFSVAPSSGVTTINQRFFLRFSPVLAARGWSSTDDVMLYPNPAHDQATVRIPGLPGTSRVQATLLNELGQVVRQQEVSLPATGTLLVLDVHGLATGVYALRLQAGNALAVRRLVVE